MTFDLAGREPFYTTPDGAIQFVPNSADGPGAYDVFIKDKAHLYIYDRTLGDLTDPDVSTERMMQNLEAMCGGIARHTLASQGISSQTFHLALLQLRIVEQGKELEEERSVYKGE